MKVIETVAAMRALIAEYKLKKHSIALVPTMGNLHAGHLELLAAAKTKASITIASIFVNPLQFGPNEDFANYPRTVKQDLEKLQNLGVDAVFLPTIGEFLGNNFQNYTKIEIPELTTMLCAKSRPGFFQGVCTIVVKIFNIINPDLAIFGEKDYQQLLVIRKVVADLSLPVTILSHPIVRADSGLALSSRNNYLSVLELDKAQNLFKVLVLIKSKIAAGCNDFSDLENEGRSLLEEQGFVVDYLEIRQADDLSLPKSEFRKRVFVAAWLGKTRLIDNLEV